jgi:hypothetical protein
LPTALLNFNGKIVGKFPVGTAIFIFKIKKLHVATCVGHLLVMSFVKHRHLVCITREYPKYSGLVPPSIQQLW